MSRQDTAAELAQCCAPLNADPLTADQAEELSRRFKALGDPVRLRLLSLIASHQGGEACDLAAIEISHTPRSGVGLWVGELVATVGLIAVIFALARTGRAALSAAAVAGWIGAAYWFTSSTSFANPAVTIGRMFSDTFAGIAPGSAPGFIAAQLVGGLLGIGLVLILYPDMHRTAVAVAVAAHPALPLLDPPRRPR